MSTTAVIERTVPTTRGWELPGFRLAQAELLKLRTRRGLVLTSLALTVGSVIVAYAILLVLHLTDPTGHGPAGGSQHFWNGMYLLTALGTMAAVLIGATAGPATSPRVFSAASSRRGARAGRCFSPASQAGWRCCCRWPCWPTVLERRWPWGWPAACRSRQPSTWSSRGCGSCST